MSVRSLFNVPFRNNKNIPNNLSVHNPYGTRNDGSIKGRGFLGEIPSNGNVMTELSIGINVGGKDISIPLIVPTLNKDEIQHLADGKKPTGDIVDKAVRFAMERNRKNLPYFATPGIDY